MKYGWIIAICLGWLLAGCQSEKEETAQPKAPVAAQPAAPAAAPAEAPAPAEPAKVVEEAKETVNEVATAAAGMGDAVAGKAKAGKCKACHSFDAGGGHKMGPNLFGIVGKAAGTAEGFKYTADLNNAGFTWNAANLAAWICDSPAAIKVLTGNPAAKTKMGKQRVCDANALNVVAYLQSLK